VKDEKENIPVVISADIVTDKQESDSGQEAELVDAEPVPPVPAEKKSPMTVKDKLTAAVEAGAMELAKKKKVNLHPLSGLLILFLDYTFWTVGITGIGLPFACAMSFILSFIGVFLIQKNLEEENTSRSLTKAFVGGIFTGLPTPFCGTIFGTLILTISGLNFLGKLLHKK